MKSIYELCKSKNLIRRNSVSKNDIVKLSKSQADKFISEFFEITQSPKIGDAIKYNHVASFSLSGGPEDCCYIKCRMQNVEQLSRFAALYSDTVYVVNPFEAYNLSKVSLKELHNRIYDDLLILLYLKPLIENERIVVLPANNCICLECFRKKYNINKYLYNKICRAWKILEKEYLVNTTVTLEKIRKSMYGVQLKGTGPLYEQETMYKILDILPESIVQNQALNSKLGGNNPIRLPNNAIKAFGFHKEMAQKVANNIIFEAAMTKHYNASFVTHKSIHLRFLDSITNDSYIENKNMISFNNLTALVPIVEDVEIKRLQQQNRVFLMYIESLCRYSNMEMEFYIGGYHNVWTR